MSLSLEWFAARPEANWGLRSRTRGRVTRASFHSFNSRRGRIARISNFDISWLRSASDKVLRRLAFARALRHIMWVVVLR